MLLELRVQNLLLIEEARLELAGGLNVLTGETGAGKTVLAHALDLLLGGRARPGIVRPGAAEAYVEGVFELDGPALSRRPAAGAALERLPADAEELVLARRVGADGRTRAYLNGRSLPLTELRELAAELLSFYGQHEHRRLMLAAAQLEILDGFCGPEQARRRSRCAASWRRLRAAGDELGRLDELAGARERELDLLDFELGEIEQLELRPGEREELGAERERLRHLEALRGAALAATELMAADQGALAGLAGAAAALDGVTGVDAALDLLGERLRTAALEAQDVVSELRAYGEELDGEPGRLEAIEERLAAVARLERKHGGTIALVLEHAERCAARRAELLGAEVAIAAAREEDDRARAEHAAAALALGEARAAAAPRLAAAVAARLDGLGMVGATFAVVLQPADPAPAGADHVQFEIAPNPGVPAAPLRDTASGGELSRVMLALLGAANHGSEATLVFDEVDAGIGGQTARAVGEQLRELGRGRQILCITHLPQVASLGSRHFTIVKDTGTEPARTTVTRLEADEVVSELVRMLGAEVADPAARRHASELLRAA
jgi:DNA repair protein RecN (Recombination protein N)